MRHQKNDIIYIGIYGLLKFIGEMIVQIGRMIKMGLEMALVSKTTAVIYGVFTLISIFYTSFFIVTLLSMFLVGLAKYIHDAPLRNRRKFFGAIFEEIGLHYNGNVPIYMRERVINDYTITFTFYGFVTIREWNKKKDELAMHLNITIINIQQDKKNNRLITLVIERQPLPELIRWNDKLIDTKRDILNIGYYYTKIVGMDLKKTPSCFCSWRNRFRKVKYLKVYDPSIVTKRL